MSGRYVRLPNGRILPWTDILSKREGVREVTEEEMDLRIAAIKERNKLLKENIQKPAVSIILQEKSEILKQLEAEQANLEQKLSDIQAGVNSQEETEEEIAKRIFKERSEQISKDPEIMKIMAMDSAKELALHIMAEYGEEISKKDSNSKDEDVISGLRNRALELRTMALIKLKGDNPQ